MPGSPRLPAAKAFCEGDAIGWQDDAYGPRDKLKALISPAGLNSWKLEEPARSVGGMYRHAHTWPASSAGSGQAG